MVDHYVSVDMNTFILHEGSTYIQYSKIKKKKKKKSVIVLVLSCLFVYLCIHYYQIYGE